jgi:hypothetical protein
MSGEDLITGLLVGAAFGALIAGIFAWARAQRLASEHAVALGERERAADVLHGTVRDQTARVRELESQLGTLQADFDKRVAEAVIVERRGSAAELTAARQIADSLRAEGEAQRAQHASELVAARRAAEVESEAAQRVRSALLAELESTKAALSRVQAEWVGLHTEMVELRADCEVRARELTASRDQLLKDLSAERSNAAAVEASLRAEITRVREERAALTAERAALAKEYAALREAMARDHAALESRAETAERALRRLRGRAAARVAAERRSGANLVRRMWEYMQPEPETPTHSTAPAGTPDSQQSCEPTPAHFAPDVEQPIPGGEAGLADEPPQPPQAEETETFAQEEAEHTPDDMPGWFDQEPEPPESQPENHPDDTADIGVTLHPLPSNLRKPMSVIQEGDTLLVVCDDGAVWQRGPEGWYESAPLPGSRSDAVHRFRQDVTREH